MDRKYRYIIDMSCFWDTIIKKLNKEDINHILGIINPDPKQFSNILKNKNCKTENVLWNSNELTDKEKEENYDHINEYDSNTINNGYMCSTCDPFLLLIAELFKIEINHVYNGTKVIYKYSKECKYSITIQSNTGHMW